MITNAYVPIEYSANATTFSFTFPISTLTDVVVNLRHVTTGVITALTYTTQYTVSSSDLTAGGTVTTLSNWGINYTLQISRVTELTQENNIYNAGLLDLEALESSVDKSTMQNQDSQNILSRCIRYPSGDTAASMILPTVISRKGKNLTFNATTGAAEATTPYTGTHTISAFGDSIISAADAAAVRTLIGITPVSDTLVAAYFNVADYGAVGDGTTDDGASLQAAIDAAMATGIRGHLIAKPGIYLTSQTLSITNPIFIDCPGVIIKQKDASELSTVINVDVSDAEDVGLNIAINGNMANNTATVIGLTIDGLRLSQSDINVSASYCDTGVLVKGNTETNIFRFNVNYCTVGVLEELATYSPDENTYFISGHDNGTHYKKNTTAGDKITSIVHLSCETSTGDAVSLNDIDGYSVTTLSGIIRGCATNGVNVVSGGHASVVFNNFSIHGAGTGHAILVNNCDYISGDVRVVSFDYGVWIKAATKGSLGIQTVYIADTNASGYGLRLGEANVSVVYKFCLKPGSNIVCDTGEYAVWLDNTYSADINLSSVSGATYDIYYGEDSNNDTVKMNGYSYDVAKIGVHAGADAPRLFLDGNAIGSFADTDTTPSVLGFSAFNKAAASAVTITGFDNAYPGQRIIVVSNGAITYDTTSNSRLVGSSADIVTATGDVTEWICVSATTTSTSVFRLVGYVDVSADNKGGA